MIISYEDFSRVELRSGTIVRVETFPKARNPSYKIWVDFGTEIGEKQTSAQVTALYSIDDLIGKIIIGCINLEPKNIAGFVSEFLLVGFADHNGDVCLATAHPKVPNGQKLF